nr:S-layer homology domain-containing protein [uncultured Oscillibacter sp.]
MKKPLRLIAALLAFCVAAATFPPVGLALEEDDLRSGGSTLNEMIEQANPGDTITLTDNVSSAAQNDQAPWVINKNITIDGQNHSINVRATGILLGADVTFRNVQLDLTSADCRNAIIANGYTLTLDSVTATSFSANVFCGTLLPASHETYVTVPTPGNSHTVNILGNTNLQGRTTNSLGAANIFAGSLAMGGLDGNHNGADDNGAENTFPGDVTINIENSAGSAALGTVYAGGGQQRIPVGEQSGKVTIPDPDKYRVGGTVTITGAAIPTVSGAGSGATNVVYQGSGNQATKTFGDISSLSVESGDLVLQNGSSFQTQPSLSVSNGAFLNIKDLGNLSVSNFQGGGSLILGQNQTLTIENGVTGTTKIGIGSIFNNASQTLPLENHTYIKAPQSQAGDFVLVPYGSNPNMTLVRDGSGSWTASSSSSGGDENRVQNFSFDTLEVSAGPGKEAEFPLTVTSSTEGALYLDFVPLNITINDRPANRSSEVIDGETYYKYTDRNGYLSSLKIIANSLYVISDAEYGTADSPYTIGITVPAAYTIDNKNITRTAVLKVEDGGTTDPEVKTIPVPTANTGLKWTGAEQTGVNEGTGYTLAGDFKATAVGNYTATAALEPGYQWTGGSTDPQTISWSIAKADGPAAPTGLAGVAPAAAGGADGKITGTTSAMEYAADPSFTNSQECGGGETVGLSAGIYYVRMKETATHEAGTSTSITVPAPGAATVTGISVSSTAHKTEYTAGESLDVTGLTIEAVYSNGDRRTVPVTADMVSGFDSSAPAESQTLTITYEGKSTSYAVRITPTQQPGGTKHQVTVSNTGEGGTEAGAYDYEEGASVTIRAGNKSGYTFAAWEATGVTLANRSVPEVSFQMPANNVSLHAIWTPDSVTPPDGHTHAWSPAWQSNETHHWHDCTASGCSITQDSLKSGYAAHAAGDWVVDRPATSSQSGTRHRSCTVCGYEMIRETIPATGGGSSGGGSSSGGSSSSGGNSSSGGSSGGTTVKNPDGSTTSTSTNKTTGTVTETTRRPDGSKTVVETKKDGTVTTTGTTKDGSTVKTVARPDGSTETTVKQASGLTASVQANQYSAKADVRIPSNVFEENPRGSVALPIPALPGENASVTVHTSSVRTAAVEIPVYGTGNTTIACLVNPDGSETILKTAIFSGGQITLNVSDGATIRIRENGKNFQDTRRHWARNAIDFVSARELFSGKTPSIFAPDASMSRTMLMTVLARLDGVDTAAGSAYETGMAWAVAQGISDGRNPDSQVTREQFVAMLHRYTGSPAATDQELHFSDIEKISAYAQEAVRWAVENGILSGYGDGSFLPEGRATRAQAAVMLERYVNYLNQQ